ncbi:hypothetical protein [Buttiauxella gaviniae]|uniref:hypothetical protein n=1 Tax=Buttiauxella gaviniae TaxID=82990 RepID=UPI0039AF325C
MAKGQYVASEVRDEVSKAICKHYSDDGVIASISLKFSTDYFPHKGQAYIYFDGSADYLLCSFVYFYNEKSEKTLSIPSDWRD